jgi:hypothetical protein
MSTDLLTYAEAGRHIGLTERSIRNYIRRGFLSSKSKPGCRTKYVSAAEVEELRALKSEQEGRPVSRQEILLLSAKIAKLEYAVQTLLTLLDAKTVPLGISAEYGKQLYQTAVEQLRRTGWTLEELEPWVEVFLRIDENDFAVLRECANTRTPWVPFIRLCVAMTDSVVADPAYATSLALQNTHRQLAEARRRMRAAAIIFEGQQGTPLSLLSETPSVSVVDALDSVLGIKK